MSAETLAHGRPDRPRRRPPRPEAVVGAALVVNLAVAGWTVTRPGERPPYRPAFTGRLAAAAGRGSALRAARDILSTACPGLVAASDEAWAADRGFFRLRYTVWVEHGGAQPRRFVVLLEWRDGGYDYLVGSAGCR